MARRAFAVAAHPDDIEFHMAGTLILLGQAGYELHYLNIANGSCGTTQYGREEIIRIRRDEAMAAAAVHRGDLPRESGGRSGDLLREGVAGARVGGDARGRAGDRADPLARGLYGGSSECVPVGGDGGVLPGDAELPDRSRRSAPVPGDVTVYHAQPHGNVDPLRQPVAPDFFVDIESVLEQKRAMLACHRSQKDWLDESQGMDSYLITMTETEP